MNPRRLIVLTVVCELLVVDVIGRLVFELQHSFVLPLLDEFRSPLILFVARITRFDAIQDDANHISRMLLVK